MLETMISIVKSWNVCTGVHRTEDLLDWITQRNENLCVEIHKTALTKEKMWFYDEKDGCIRNQGRSFFQITGFERRLSDGGLQTQPIILQQEIGYLGIICQEINGVMHFLMQAKIEPGNINKIQISPTIQATKSNFTQKHGGAKPPYLEYFENASRYEIVVDQIQSEQSSRFYKKRNRNILIRVDEEVPVLPSHKWMTLGQLKQLMRQDNLINMDTRTVLSCIPFYLISAEHAERARLSDCFTDPTLYRSIFYGDSENHLPQLYQYINNYKMFDESNGNLIPLHKLQGWSIAEDKIYCERPYPYQVIYCDIAIEGREVRRWTQPLFEAMGIATFGLFCCEMNGVMKFLVHAMPELGSFDGIELGPTVQHEAVPFPEDKETVIDRCFAQKLQDRDGVFYDHLLSEEGGRFYHEQNRNVMIRVDAATLPALPEGYFWVDYRTLNELVQVNNTLNIQLRNLLSLLEA